MSLPKPESKVGVDPNFDKQLHALQAAAAQAAAALRTGGQVRWMRPDAWNGDPNDYEGIHDACNREVANSQFVDTVKDAQHPGRVGDIIAATLMVDYLGVLERSFRQRLLMGRVRRYALTAGRQQGNGSDTGVFIQADLEYLRRIVKQTKGPR